MIGGEKLNEEKGEGGEKNRKSRNNRSVKMNVPRRCSRPGYRDRFIKRWKSFVSASRGRVAINCNKKQKRYGHLVRVVQRFRSARQPLIDIYRRWKRFEKLKTGCCLSPFLGCASFPLCPFSSRGKGRFEFGRRRGNLYSTLVAIKFTISKILPIRTKLVPILASDSRKIQLNFEKRKNF